MGWLRRTPKPPPPPVARATAAAATPRDRRLADLVRQFTVAGVADPDRMARKAAGAGFQAGHIKTTERARYVVSRAEDVDQAKRFLLDDLTVDEALTYFVVETPDGTWGTDIEGIYLENLLPWQKDVARAQCTATIIGVNIYGLPIAARGVTDNFVVELECGRCGAHWRDGVAYRAVTAARCPGCRTVNRVDSQRLTAETLLSPPEPVEPATLSVEPSPLTPAQLAEPRLVARRLVELADEFDRRTADLTEAQRKLRRDCEHLDRLLTDGGAAESGFPEAVEVRAIGHQLARAGGQPLLEDVRDKLDPVTQMGANAMVTLLWAKIAGWRG